MPLPDGIPIEQLDEVMYQVARRIRLGAGRMQEFVGPMQLPEAIEFTNVRLIISANELERSEVTNETSTETPGTTTATRTPLTTETRTETPGTVTRTSAPAVDVTEADPSTETNSTFSSASSGGRNTTDTARTWRSFG